MTTMNAARIHQFGSADVIHMESVEIPTPAPDEVLIQVGAASINPVDYKIREGQFPPVQADQLPLTLGRDLAGIVQAVGSRVSNVRKGDAVFSMVGADGSYADYALVKASYVAPVPPKLDFATAASVPLAAQTAWQALFDHGKLQAEQSVLIHGASGGVGHFAVQLAKAAGATVYATASAENLEFLRSLGADLAIDYEAQHFEHICQNIDLVIDLVAGETQERSWAVLREGGRLVSTLSEPKSERPEAQGKIGTFFLVEPDGEQLEKIARLIESGQVRPVLSKTFPLEEVAEAQDFLEHSHVKGKVVLVVR
ncbi:NADP-dependent oxidoreductase [Pseudomonas sp. PDM14]|uniref:NADP-dependent oxidoreductase n=1 Tax=Pseudomonas sp. PDM14 TaxID=2769288 RepID=UPI001CE1539A|nr:NADP-dependent oxidoreductase [Pseudomonas sp. PDM14]